jgi:threonyl-tRNA synthetase
VCVDLAPKSVLFAPRKAVQRLPATPMRISANILLSGRGSAYSVELRLNALFLNLLMSESTQQPTIRVQLPDGAVREVPAGTTPLAIAESISPRLAAAVVVARIRPLRVPEAKAENDAATAASMTEEAMYSADDVGAERLVDLRAPLTEDVALSLIKESEPDALRVVRHSAAHVMATALLELFPDTKLGHGPATDSGFFYDVYRETPLKEEDLRLIEGRMAEVVARDEPFVRVYEPRAQGLGDYEKQGDFMKVHFIERFTQPGEEISLYKNGGFTDFCRGPHVPSTGRVKAFRVLSLAGAYWLGDESNPQLQRIYGTAFFNQKDMDAHFARLDEIAKRDHRVLGRQLDLFSIQELAGAGLVFWHPKGAIIRKTMEDWMKDECIRRGYELVYTPHVAKVNLWQTSGHEGFYADNMFTPMELDDADYRMKPMNCPFHILIYKNSPKSYRDLPVRYAELGNVYRYERSGTMHGLLRVRGFTQDDAHIFCTPDQIENEVVGCIDFAEAVLRTFGFDSFQVELSTWDPKDRDVWAGSDDNWAQATQALQRALERKGIAYKTIPGEAAFYGPKIDIKLVDVLGRLWQLSTVQFDFNLPARFELEYVGEDGARHQPVMVHRALFGSVERFFGVLIEHYAGAFPLWLAPIQVGLVPIAERHLEYAQQVKAQLELIGLRVELDGRNEKMNAKIRELTLQKVPYLLVLGDKEAEANSVSVRTRGKGDGGSMPLLDFLEKARSIVASHATEL